MQAKDARGRWQAEHLRSVGRRLSDAAKSMRMGAMPESPFGLTNEGFEDYRGITLAEAVRYLSIERVDLSDALFKDGASINESEAKGCKFERIDMRNVFVRRKFDSCSFVGAKLNGARLGGSSLAVTSRVRICPGPLRQTVGLSIARLPGQISQAFISSVVYSMGVTSQGSRSCPDPLRRAGLWAVLPRSSFKAVSRRAS